MSEFFRAAVLCDPRVAKQSPLYVDEVRAMEGRYKHERLVEACVAAKSVVEEANRSLCADPFAGGSPVVSKYAPSSRDMLVPPPQRRVGTSQLKRQVHDVIFDRSRRLNEVRGQLTSLEEREWLDNLKKQRQQTELYEQEMQKARRGARSLGPSDPISSSSQSTAEMGAAAHRNKRTPHPIDVVHQRVQAAILSDLSQQDAAEKDVIVRRQESLEDHVDRSLLGAGVAHKLPCFKLPGPDTRCPAPW